MDELEHGPPLVTRTGLFEHEDSGGQVPRGDVGRGPAEEVVAVRERADGEAGPVEAEDRPDVVGVHRGVALARRGADVEGREGRAREPESPEADQIVDGVDGEPAGDHAADDRPVFQPEALEVPEERAAVPVRRGIDGDEAAFDRKGC